MSVSQAVVQRLWNYCNLLRDDGMSQGDYVEQLTYLLFLKMAHEPSQPPYGELSRIPVAYDWPGLLSRDAGQYFQNFTLKTNPLTRAHLDDPVDCKPARPSRIGALSLLQLRRPDQAGQGQPEPSLAAR